METLVNNPAGADGALELAELASSRRDLYRFLSAAFLAEPSAEFLAHLQEESFQTALAEWFTSSLVEDFRRVTEAMNAEAFSQSARREFTNLFLVPGGQHIAPYESVFRDRREIEGREVSGLLMGQSALDVQKWYRLAALELSGDCKELPDHIGLEFHYLAYLCEKEMEFGDAGNTASQTRAREMQRDFLKAHVLAWLGDLAGRIRAKSALPLYPAIASLAVEFCQAELATLEAVVGPSCGSLIPAYAN
ncbi:MAG: TorD/DmsD family molecular chaperone [Limisphaerales bacterium]